MAETPVVETAQEKFARETAEFAARQLADAKLEADQAKLEADRKAYEESPEGKRAAARNRELKTQANRDFLTSDRGYEFSDTTENALKLQEYLAANNLPWTAENLAKAYDAQKTAGKLTPRPYVAPVADTPKPFDTQGMTLEKWRSMPAKQMQDYYKRNREIVDFLVSQGNQGRS